MKYTPTHMNQASGSSRIPCSVAILTSKADGLEPCLESLKDFAEIIVCHGNAPEENLAIARAYGATIVQQYDTDEPNVTSFMDKAAVRERAMSASTQPWRFFVDRDDRLSKEAIEEIRTITQDPHPAHLVWRMPSRVYIEDKEILHYSSYPAYQTRLVHESVGAHFKGLVHERLVFDAHTFTVGTMRSHYNFRWPQQRVEHYWKYLREYANREIQTTYDMSLGSFLYWGVYRRLRTILGYVLWRLPALYLRYGFKNTMPLSIELATVRYHMYIFFGNIKHFIATRTWSIMLVETLRGKDLNRILCNIAVQRWEGYGRVLDIGGREGKSSYWRYLQTHRWHRVTTVDIDASSHPDVVIDLEREELPFADGHFDTALMFNLLEHLNKREQVVARVARVLGNSGTLLGVVPFLVAVHPDPHDFVRLTNEGLHELFTHAGFSKVEVVPVGRGPLTASYYQSEFLWPRVVKLLLIPLVLGLDAIILSLRPHWRKKFPLSYAFKAQR